MYLLLPLSFTRYTAVRIRHSLSMPEKLQGIIETLRRITTILIVQAQRCCYVYVSLLQLLQLQLLQLHLNNLQLRHHQLQNQLSAQGLLQEESCVEFLF